MKTFLLLAALLVATVGRAQIPVTDFANLVNNQLSQVENIAKWVESIAQLKTQIDQLNRQISIQDDIRDWSGNPAEAGTRLALDGLGEGDLLKTYGRTRAAIIGASESLESLSNTGDGSYRAIPSADLDGKELGRDPLTFRRYAVLDATRANSETVADETKSREAQLQADVAETLTRLKAAPTDAEVQKEAAKLTALNGQLALIESTRRREVDAVTLQKIANDARLEEERLAAAELAAKDDYLANQRVTAYLASLKVRGHAAP